MTACQCPVAGWCERHRCQKTEHWHKLCQTRDDYFRLWEEGRGPGQTQGAEPGLLQKGMNFVGAAARHLANGCRQVSDDVYETRLSFCRACPSLDVEQMMCREFNCGCYVERKARWASEECPLQRWGRDEPAADSGVRGEQNQPAASGPAAEPET